MEKLKIFLILSVILNLGLIAGLSVVTAFWFDRRNCKPCYPNFCERKCGDGTAWKDGKCRINFQDDKEDTRILRMLDVCDTPQYSKLETYVDLEEYASRGYIPKRIEYGYKNAACDRNPRGVWIKL